MNTTLLVAKSTLLLLRPTETAPATDPAGALHFNEVVVSHVAAVEVSVPKEHVNPAEALIL